MGTLGRNVADGTTHGNSATDLIGLTAASSVRGRHLTRISVNRIAVQGLPVMRAVLAKVTVNVFPLLMLTTIFGGLALSILGNCIFTLV